MKLSELKFGIALSDMHYGVSEVLKKIDGIGEIINNHKIITGGGCKAIEEILKSRKGSGLEKTSYTNKMLVLVGKEYKIDTVIYQFAYSYDDNCLGFIDIAVDD